MKPATEETATVARGSEAKPRDQAERATFGGGCFWCVEAVFEQVRGVEAVVSGYAGGTVENPTYEEVCGGETGHAEVVQVTFDRSVVSFRDLMEIFLTTHDPTTPNRQGADVGTQYRSIVLYHTPEQKRVAEDVIREFGAKGVYEAPIVTEVAPFTAFHPAEEYHRQYYRRNPSQGYCRAVISPKVAKFRAAWASKLKA